MFIAARKIWGPLAGVATALLFVLILDLQSGAPDEFNEAAPQPVAVADVAHNR